MRYTDSLTVLKSVCRRAQQFDKKYNPSASLSNVMRSQAHLHSAWDCDASSSSVLDLADAGIIDEI